MANDDALIPGGIAGLSRAAVHAMPQASRRLSVKTTRQGHVRASDPRTCTSEDTDAMRREPEGP